MINVVPYSVFSELRPAKASTPNPVRPIPFTFLCRIVTHKFELQECSWHERSVRRKMMTHSSSRFDNDIKRLLGRMLVSMALILLSSDAFRKKK